MNVSSTYSILRSIAVGNGDGVAGTTVGVGTRVGSGRISTGSKLGSLDNSNLSKRVPISRSGDFVNAEGITCLYRSILLPLSGDQKSIDYLLGAANYREVVHD